MDLPFLLRFTDAGAVATMELQIDAEVYCELPCIVKVGEAEYGCVLARLARGVVRLIAPREVLRHEAGASAVIVGIRFPAQGHDSATRLRRLRYLQESALRQRKQDLDRAALCRLFRKDLSGEEPH